MVFSVQTFDGSRGRCLNTKPKVEQSMVDQYSCIFTLNHLKTAFNNCRKLTKHRRASSASAILSLWNTVMSLRIDQ